ncbi:hypothetical protein GGX14DRAFT_609349 [Mycena pura]|uniref:Uncharacterized protein n=1 Tax=Mycena pura TaxID=153505 RepID=A0AAD6UPS7_9AGAR|nr:hypothetical protein GGX14DRAFT_609349 [Mycena pura]
MYACWRLRRGGARGDRRDAGVMRAPVCPCVHPADCIQDAGLMLAGSEPPPPQAILASLEIGAAMDDGAAVHVPHHYACGSAILRGGALSEAAVFASCRALVALERAGLVAASGPRRRSCRGDGQRTTAAWWRVWPTRWGRVTAAATGTTAGAGGDASRDLYQNAAVRRDARFVTVSELVVAPRFATCMDQERQSAELRALGIARTRDFLGLRTLSLPVLQNFAKYAQAEGPGGADSLHTYGLHLQQRTRAARESGRMEQDWARRWGRTAVDLVAASMDFLLALYVVENVNIWQKYKDFVAEDAGMWPELRDVLAAALRTSGHTRAQLIFTGI